MKNKGLFILLLLLFLIATAGAGLGYYQNNKRNQQVKPPVEEKVKIVYLYFLEDKQVNTIPRNTTTTDEEGNVTTQNSYKYLKFSCTNDLTGEFDEEKWEFVPAEEKDSTCSLYFANSSYSVEFTVVNGTANENNPKRINREENGEFVITPHEGYEFKDCICSNGKETTWNAKNNTLTINAITSDLICKVNFAVETLSAKFTVVNGTGNATETAEYGGSVNAIVEAKDGYEKPKIECSNKQTATYADNKVTIEKLTKNTECKITFSAVPVEKFKLTVELPDQVTSVGGPTTQEISAGKDGTIILETSEGYVSQIDCGDVKPIETVIDSYTIKYSFLSIKKNITCKVTAINN